MSETQPLYIKDSYIKNFEATITKAGPKYVLLDKTAFYPEGGGQPSDTGTLTFDNQTIKVVKVIKRGNQVYHYLEDDLPEGISVHGKLDWSSRFWNMRRHSGEHLLTGLFEAAGSGLKVFSSLEQLDFKPSELNEEIVERVAEKFDKIIEADIPVHIYNTSRNKLDVGDDQRKLSFLEKIPRNIQRLRMVEIGEDALTFCMGTHVKNTGDIGKLKNIRLEHKKKKRKIVFFELLP